MVAKYHNYLSPVLGDFWWYGISVFGPFRQPGQDKKKGLGRTKKLYKMKLNIILWYFLFFDPEKYFFFRANTQILKSECIT